MQIENSKRTIVSNFVSLDALCRETSKFNHRLIGDDMRPWRLHRVARGADVVVLDNSYKHLIGFCFLKMIIPIAQFKLMFVDTNLYQPETFRSRIVALFKTVCLKQVDRFAQLFKNTRGYERYYGIEPARSRYLPFKVNGWEDDLRTYRADPCLGTYVLCAGRTLRDHKTFLEAMALCGLPGVLLVPDDSGGTGVVTESAYKFPSNVRLEIHSDGKQETFIEWIKKSAIVVIPRFSTAISPNGISTYLMAMGAWRCVVLTKGPGADDLLIDGEAILVDPEDPKQLAEAVRVAWNDLDKRRSVALKGRRRAEEMQGSQRYLADLTLIINELLDEKAL